MSRYVLAVSVLIASVLLGACGSDPDGEGRHGDCCNDMTDGGGGADAGNDQAR